MFDGFFFPYILFLFANHRIARLEQLLLLVMQPQKSPYSMHRHMHEIPKPALITKRYTRDICTDTCARHPMCANNGRCSNLQIPQA